MPFDFSPFWISLRIALCAGIIVFVLGVLCGWTFLWACGWKKWLAEVVFTLPLVLPPTVIGFLLLVALGKNSPAGKLLSSMGLSLIFTWQGAVLAASVVSFPLMYRAAKGAFEQVDIDLVWAARTLGMSEWQVFRRILMPQAFPGIAAGAVLSFARGLGEFGATLMLAGNIPGRTQTIPIAIYFATAAGNMKLAAIWTGVITLMSCLALGGIHWFGVRLSRTKSGGVV